VFRSRSLVTLRRDRRPSDEEDPVTADHPYVSQKEITFVIPCYNSAEYMDHCIDSILRGQGRHRDHHRQRRLDEGQHGREGRRVGAAPPRVIKVIHQENKGHGGAVMAGLRAASGVYFKVVDSDDWLDPVALNLMLSKLRHFIASGSPVDLVVANYVYEHTNSGTQKVIRYRRHAAAEPDLHLERGGLLRPGQNILMHSAIFRTQVLRDSGVELPEHTFYVDNIFVYVPLPSVQTLYYLPVNLYRYFIGREDQSVNESVQISRLDQQMRVTDIMVEAHKLPEGAGNRRLAGYMEQYLGLIVTASIDVRAAGGHREGPAMRREMWEHIDAIDPILKAPPGPAPAAGARREPARPAGPQGVGGALPHRAEALPLQLTRQRRTADTVRRPTRPGATGKVSPRRSRGRSRAS
jgi:hypothetical protein